MQRSIEEVSEEDDVVEYGSSTAGDAGGIDEELGWPYLAQPLLSWCTCKSIMAYGRTLSAASRRISRAGDVDTRNRPPTSVLKPLYKSRPPERSVRLVL